MRQSIRTGIYVLVKIQHELKNTDIEEKKFRKRYCRLLKIDDEKFVTGLF